MMNHERVKMRRHGTEDAEAQGFRGAGIQVEYEIYEAMRIQEHKDADVLKICRKSSY